MKHIRTSMFLLSAAVLLVLVFFGAQLQVSTVFAVPSFTKNNPVALGANTCAGSGCHSSSGTPGKSAVTGFPAGMTYSPGTPIPLTITVTDPTQSRFGFELTARLMSNTALAAGTFTAGTGSNLGTDVVPVVQGVASSATFTATWTPPTTAAGPVTFYLTGLAGGCCTDGLSTGMYTLTPLAVATPNFTLSASPATVSVAPGASGSSTMTVTPTNGFTGTVSYTVSGLPSGVTSSFTANTLTLSASSSAAAGTSPVTVTGTSGALSHTATVNLTVTGAAPAPNFTLSTVPGSVTVAPGGSGMSTMTVTPSGGFAGTVAYTVSGLPIGVTSSFTANTLTLSASSSAAAGTSTITITGTSGVLSHPAMVSLTVSSTTTSPTLSTSPSSLSFNYQMGGRTPSSRTLSVTSTGGSTSYTATETDPWLSIAPKSGTGTPGSIMASVNPSGMAPGSYGAQINITAANGKTITIPVALTITSGSGGGEESGGTPGNMNAQPFVSDTQSGALAAAWVDNMGTSPHGGSDPRNRALVLSKGTSAPNNSWAGANIQNVTGMSLTELGLDFRAGIQCSTATVHFLITTTDGTSHTLGGCNSSAATAQSTAPTGWMRLRFDPGTASPAINPNDQVQSISLVLDQGSIAVIDNIYINSAFTGKGSSNSSSTSPSRSRSRDD